ncbi:MAG: AarF/UbiB family protein [Fusobacteriaceae bacterium]
MNSLNYFYLIRSFKKNKFPKIETIRSMGLMGIRIAQEYSRRIDILSEEMCYYLMDIRSSLIPIAPKHFLTLIPRESNLLHILEYFDNDPFIYSFINQVYRGCLKNGLDVSIKVIDPRAKNIFMKDLNLAKKRSKLLSKIAPILSKRFLTEDIINNIEMNNLKKLSFSSELSSTNYLYETKEKYAQEYNLEKLNFPNIYPNYSTPEYLVGDYIQGESVKELLENNFMNYQNVLEIIRLHFFYIFILGKFHSDIHAGNILINEENHIYFIDCNSLTEIDDKFRITFFKFLEALTNQEYNKAGKFISELSLIKVLDDKFLAKIEILFRNSKELSMKKINISKKIMSAFKLGTSYGMTFDENLFSVLKALVRLEYIAFKTNPKAIFIKDLKVILNNYTNDSMLKYSNQTIPAE